MKKKICIGLILVFLSSSFFCFAQQKNPTAVFETESHDFGKINESNGPAVFNFVLTNTGATPLILKSVQASCGCTTPQWPKEPILPGAKGTIIVSYNPQNRPGRFEKQITVVSNGQPETQILHISGEVIPRTLTIEEIYPISFDGLRLKQSQITFNNIAPNQKTPSTLEVYNSSDQPLTIKFNEVPSHISIKITPEIIQVKGKAQIEVIYDATVKNDWGFVFDRIAVLINGKDNPNNRLSITANIQEDFSQLTPDQKANAPKVEVDNLTFDFGTIKPGDKASHDYVIKNSGKSDLIIHKVQPTCGCTVTNLQSKIIKPGQSTVISTTFSSEGKNGAQNKNIAVITNDPINPKLNLYIKGIIQ
jgi:hypothetical protein